MPHRILIISNNRDFPRLNRGLADDAAALRRHFVDRDPLNGLTTQALHTDTQSRPPVADRPAANWGGARG